MGAHPLLLVASSEESTLRQTSRRLASTLPQGLYVQVHAESSRICHVDVRSSSSSAYSYVLVVTATTPCFESRTPPIQVNTAIFKLPLVLLATFR